MVKSITPPKSDPYRPYKLLSTYAAGQRDRHFSADKSLRAYAEEARDRASIIAKPTQAPSFESAAEMFYRVVGSSFRSIAKSISARFVSRFASYANAL